MALIYLKARRHLQGALEVVGLHRSQRRHFSVLENISGTLKPVCFGKKNIQKRVQCEYNYQIAGPHYAAAGATWGW